MADQDQRAKDRQEVFDALEDVQRKKEHLLQADADRNEDLYGLAERKLTEAETEMETKVQEYKDKYGANQ